MIGGVTASAATGTVGHWLRGHRSLAITTTSALIVGALVTTLAVFSGGYDRQRYALGDGSVWVANGARQVVGRANTEVVSLDTVVAITGRSPAITQQGKTVLVADPITQTLQIIDAATAAVTETVALPPSEVTVALAGENVVIHSASTGALWIVPLRTIDSFDSGSVPSLTVGADSVVSVSPRGILFAYSAVGKAVYRLNAAAVGSAVTRTPITFGRSADSLAITSVGEVWVLLNRSTGQLRVAGHPASYFGSKTPDASAVLQHATDDDAEAVALSSSAGLSSVPLDGSRRSVLLAATVSRPGVGGVAVAPMVRSGCLYAAWSNGASVTRCAGVPQRVGTLDEIPGEAKGLLFVANGNRLVLNDPQTGRTWAVQRGGALIDNWAQLIVATRPEVIVERTQSTASESVLEKTPQPPVAVDDEFGARPGRATVLPVLLNDFDRNGDVLAVTETTPTDSPAGVVEVIGNRQQLLLRLNPAAVGVVSFGYTVSDGRGGTASAQVTVTVKLPTENSPPKQLRETSALAVSGGRATVSVLGDWADPEGDAFYLSAAIAPSPNTANFDPQGEIEFVDGGGTPGVREVTLRVSDSQSEGSGILRVTIAPAGRSPLVADPFIVNTAVGRTVTIRPLEHVRGGTGVIRLASVPAKSGSTIEVSLLAGTFTFTSVEPGTHYLDFVVSDAEHTGSGVVRVDVAASPDANAAPITVPQTIFMHPLSQETVEVATADIDPAGGVLLVTGISVLTEDSGIRSEILEYRAVRITLLAPLIAGPVAVGYRVSNGLTEADGVLTVVQIAEPTRRQPPVANDDAVTVRAGDAISIAVLENDKQRDGDEVTVNPRLVRGLPEGSGLLFVSGNQLRYLAPNTPGNFSAVYEISGRDDQVAQAQVTIAVREIVPSASNAMPVPIVVTARVIAGATVRVQIPLSGIDPDGDSVQLLGPETSPARGAVTAVGVNYLDYTAGPYSAGTDTFAYAVGDSLGLRASGTVRIGIIPAQAGSHNPVAAADEVRIRPGTTVTVDVLANDFDPDGGRLAILAVVPNSRDTRAEISGAAVRVAPPLSAGRYGLVYTIANERGGTSANFLTVVVDPLAPAAYPVATDTVLTLSDIAGRDTVSVAVLDNVAFAEGPVSALTLSLLAGADTTARITAGKQITVTVAARRQIIPFAVANPTEPSAVSYAFVWVPGFDDALPQPNRQAPPLTVKSETPVTIAINDYVIAAAAKKVRLTQTITVEATHSNGDTLVVDDSTLRFTSAPGYFGPASISFEVTDSVTPDAAGANRATIVLPIVVVPRVNQPPVFAGGVISFEPGESKTIDLVKLTAYPAPGNPTTLRFRVPGAQPIGFDYTITGTTMQISARNSATKGSTAEVLIAVSDDSQPGLAGRLMLNVVSSTRPLAQPVADTIVAPRGKTTTFDLLSNDEATNPFPGTALRVIALAGAAGSGLPTGVSYTLTPSGSTLKVTISADAAPIDTTLQYQVADATGDPSRNSFGSVRISVQDRPDTPVPPIRADASYREGELTLRLTPPPANNAPILGYRVVSANHGGYQAECGLSLRCVLTDLIPGRRYELAVIATNAVGDSDPSQSSIPVGIDYLPAAPAAVSAVATASNPTGAAILVRWSAVADPSRGSRVSGYTVTVTGPSVAITTLVGATTTSLETTAANTLRPNLQYLVTVAAQNDAAVFTPGEWRSAEAPPITTIGPPIAAAGGLSAVTHGSTGAIVLSWGASSPNGATAVRYSIGRFDGPPLADACSLGTADRGIGSGSAAADSGWTDTRTTDGESYSYILYSENELFCTATASAAVESRAAPGAATGEAAIVLRDGRADLRVVAVGVASGIATRFQARLGGGTWFDTAGGGWLTSAADASVYGRPQTVTFRGCRDASTALCGAESAAQTLRPVNARGTIDACLIGAVPRSQAPVNANSPAVNYRYSYNDGSSINNRWSDFAMDATAPPPATIGDGITRVRLQTEVRFGSGAWTRDDRYAEALCRAASE